MQKHPISKVLGDIEGPLYIEVFLICIPPLVMQKDLFSELLGGSY